MRLVGILQNENDARRLASHLKRVGIDNNCDVAFDAQSGHMSYHLWIHDEDRFVEAQKIFDQFAERPSSAAFDTPITEQVNEEAPLSPSEELSTRPSVRVPFTTFILSLCALVFMLNFIEEYSMAREGSHVKAGMMTPIQSLLLFDVPPVMDTLSPAVEDLSDLEEIPFWRGAYQWVLLKFKGQDTSMAEGPLFGKIRQGEVWRLISPVVLHRDFLHILFNMVWVWVLSRPIEQKIGIIRLLILSLACGIGSNIAQYLMSGPLFIGYSGIVMGLAGFTWMREQIAPWEGYPLQKSTILFLLLFIGGMFALQSVSFLLQIFTSIHFEPNIANTAHVVGAPIGAALGRLSFFSMRAAR